MTKPSVNFEIDVSQASAWPLLAASVFIAQTGGWPETTPSRRLS